MVDKTTGTPTGNAPNQRINPDAPVGRDGAYAQADTPFPAALGAKATSPTGNPITITDAPEQSENTAFKSEVKAQTAATGNSGTQVFGGYFSEEYLATLRGRMGAKQWDEMRRSEAQIAMLMNAIMNPIKAANWDFEAYDDSNAEFVKQAELVKMCMLEMIDFNTFKHEALTTIPFGFSLFEVVHSVVMNHPKFGSFNGLKALGFRSQKTIENWQLEAKTGRLLGVNQYTYSDLGGNQFIPGAFLLCITNLKEGDNYEGISALRPMLGAYKRKELYLKLAAIGIEKYAIGTPIGTVPKGKERTAEYDFFVQTLQNYTSHEAAFITLPEGWKIEVQKNEFDSSKLKEMLTFENTEFANAVVGNFLALGMNGAGGAYALGSNLGEFFTSGIQSYADLICDAVNRTLIPDLIKLNFGPQSGYPKMKVSGISDKAGKELAETIKFLADSRTLDPDKPLKEWLRKMYKMPKPDVSTATAMPAIPSGGSTNYPKPNDPVVNPATGKIEPFSPNQLVGDGGAAPSQAQLAEDARTIQLADKKYVAKFDANKDRVKKLMLSQLPLLYAGLKDILRKKYKAASGSDKILVAKGVETPGLNGYKAALRDQLSTVAADSLASARRMIPSKKNVKLAESKFNGLPTYIRNIVAMQASLTAETQASDLEKAVFFQFTTSAAKSDDIDAILNDVDESVLPTLEDGSTGLGMNIDAAAGDTVAHVTQQASMSFFTDSDVVDEIESFTFTNEDPVSPCCQELAGTTFAVGDPDLDRYQPPLHHNCKSRLVPNMRGAKGNPDIDRGGVSLPQKALDAIKF